jgi:hypothetical protein
LPVNDLHSLLSQTVCSIFTSTVRFGPRIFFVGICGTSTAAPLKRWLQKLKFYSAAAVSPEQLFLGACGSYGRWPVTIDSPMQLKLCVISRSLSRSNYNRFPLSLCQPCFPPSLRHLPLPVIWVLRDVAFCSYGNYITRCCCCAENVSPGSNQRDCSFWKCHLPRVCIPQRLSDIQVCDD